VDTYEWFSKQGGTFRYCQEGDCKRKFRTMAKFRRHFRKEHADG